MAEESTPQVCPVDHKTREAWLAKARAAGTAQPAPPHPIPDAASTTTTSAAAAAAAAPVAAEPVAAAVSPQGKAIPPSATHYSIPQPGARLSTERVVSTIPRAPDAPADAATGSHGVGSVGVGSAARAANHEQETGADRRTGNWIYPSEEMFFNAMRRKNYDARPDDMHAIVPIHNAVNEKAWQEIKRWEKGWGAEACGGPRLASFSGLAHAMTPKARLNTLLGYSAPFDRHDWVVDRCGTKVEYVIDFYAGRDEGKPGKSLNFYLDVRPKLNTWEGWKMRAARLVGWSS